MGCLQKEAWVSLANDTKVQLFIDAGSNSFHSVMVHSKDPIYKGVTIVHIKK